MKCTGFQERDKIADIWEDDVYVIINQPHEDIPVYTVENQTGEGMKTVHQNLLLSLPTVLDWMRPLEPGTLITDNPVAEDTVSERESSDEEEDSESSGDEAVCTHTRAQHKIKRNISKSETEDQNISNIMEPENQEIERQSDSDSNS